MTPEEYMKVALEEANIAVKNGERPCGVIVVDRKGKIIWRDHPRMQELTDPTAHAEMSAIRSLCPKLNTLSLNDYVFYVTSEPCPTCLTSLIKAQVPIVYYGAKTEATASLPIPAEELAARSKKFPIKVVGGILEKECLMQRENNTP